jgi:hypothetical protein
MGRKSSCRPTPIMRGWTPANDQWGAADDVATPQKRGCQGSFDGAGSPSSKTKSETITSPLRINGKPGDNMKFLITYSYPADQFVQVVKYGAP